MAYDLDLMIGVARLLDATGHGVYNPEAVYMPGQTGIVFDTMPASPDNVIVLSAYGVSDDPSQEVNVTGLQVRTRVAGQDPRPGRDLAADIFTELHGRTNQTLSTGLQVAQILRTSFTSGGQDENRRWSVIQNFYAHVHAPSMHAFEETP